MQTLPHQFTSSFRGASGPGQLALEDRGCFTAEGATGSTEVEPDAESGGGPNGMELVLVGWSLCTLQFLARKMEYCALTWSNLMSQLKPVINARMPAVRSRVAAI